MICESCRCNVSKLVPVSCNGELRRVCFPCRRAYIREQSYMYD